MSDVSPSTDLTDEIDPDGDGSPATIEELFADLSDLTSESTASETRDEVLDVKQLLVEAHDRGLIDSGTRDLRARDAAEAFVGSVIFASPLLVEDGIFDIAEFFLSFRVGLFPVYFLVNVVFVLLMILALVSWAGPKDVKVLRPILGFVPRRLVGTALASFLTAAALMTMLGLGRQLGRPLVALARISVDWTVASFGAALRDILPGERSGADINDDLEALGDLTSDGSERSEPREPDRNE